MEPATEPVAIRKLKVVLGTGKLTEPTVIATTAVVTEEEQM